jgi:hypothetical protein
MQIKKSINGLLALVLVSTTLLAGMVGCTGSSAEAIKIVPPNANFIAEVQLNELLNDQELIDAINENQDQSVDDMLDEVRDETGLDLRDFSRILIFGDLDNSSWGPGSEYMGFIVQGNFNEDNFIQSIEDVTDEQMNTSDYKGYTLYTNDVDEYTIAFVSNKMFVFGTMQAVKDSIDVHKGDKGPVSGLILEAYNKLSDASINCALEIPNEIQQSFGGEESEAAPFQMGAFSEMDVLSFSFDKAGDNLAIKLFLHFLNASAVEDAQDTLDGLITFMKGMAELDEVKDLLDKIKITTSGVWLDVSLKTTISELEGLSEMLPTD